MPSTSRGSTPARVGRTGARFAGAVPAEDAGEEPRGTAPRFESVLRGYDRDQVEAFLARQTRETAGLREELVDVRRQLGAATARAEAAEADNANLRAVPSPGADGFGHRAERLLRLAETEAAEIRRDAARDAAELAARAREDAEAHRHQTEQQLIARTAEIEHLAATRTAALKQREDQLAAHVDTARAEADRIRAAARAEADRVRGEATAAAAETRRRTDAEAARTRTALTEDIARLETTRHDAHDSIRHLVDLVTGQLAEPSRR